MMDTLRPQNDALLVGTVDGTVQRIPLNPPDAKDGHYHHKNTYGGI